MDFKWNDSVALSRFVAFAKLLVMICDYPDTGILKVSFEVFCQTPKTGPISICLLHMDVYNHPWKAISFRKEGRGEATPDKGSAHGSRWGLRPYPPVIGFMAGWHWQKCGFQFAFTVQTAQNVVSWFSGKSVNCCHQMSDFKTKMHQIRFRLGLRPRPRWELTALPQTP